MHWIRFTIAAVCLAAPFTYAQEALETGDCVVARAPVAATANGALDLRAFGPTPAVKAPELRADDLDSPPPAPDSSCAAKDTNESANAESVAPLDTEPEREPSVTVASSVLSQDAPIVVPKGQHLTREISEAVPWYRTPYLALLAVLGLIVAASMAFKRWVPATRPVSPNTLRVLGRVAIAAKQSAVLLHVGRRVVLVGVSTDNVRPLAEIRDPDEVAALLGQSAVQNQTAGFEQALAREIETYPEEADPKDVVTPVDEALLEKTQGQLHGLLSKLRAMQSAPSA